MEEKKQTHWKKEFDYKYLGAHDLLPGESKILTIKETKSEMVKGPDGKEKECFVANFLEGGKPMIMNKTNCKAIEKVYQTPYVEDWSGKKVIIYAQSGVKAFGEIVDALRIKKENPDVNTHAEITALYEIKKDSIPKEQKAAVLRVTTNKETNNYQKTLNYLKSV